MREILNLINNQKKTKKRFSIKRYLKPNPDNAIIKEVEGLTN